MGGDAATTDTRGEAADIDMRGENIVEARCVDNVAEALSVESAAEFPCGSPAPCARSAAASSEMRVWSDLDATTGGKPGVLGVLNPWRPCKLAVST